MLKIFRNKENMKKILWVITIVIVISFGFFGTAYLLQDVGISKAAGKIFNRSVSIENYLKAEQIVFFSNYQLYGDNFNRLKEFLDINQQTWDRLILLHEAKKRKIKVTDEEVVEAIQQFPFFQRDAQFDTLLYKDILRYQLKIQPRDFEEGMRNTIKIAKLYEQVTLPIGITEDEMLSEYKKANEKVKVKYIAFPAEQYKESTSVSEAQIKNYYENHKNEFSVPQSIKVNYITLPLTEDMTDEQKQPLIDQADEIYDQLLDTSDLNSVAKKNNLKVETTDYFHRDQPNLKLGWSFDVLQEAFELSVNEFSAPIETPKGIYILKVTDLKERHIPELAKVKDKVFDAAKLQNAKTLAKEAARESLRKLSSALPNAEFDAAVQTLNLKTQETPAFTRGQYLPSIGISKDFQNTAFSLTKDNPLGTDVVETPNGYCIVYLKERVSIDMAAFEQEKTTLEQQLTVKKKNDAFNDFTAKLRIESNLVDKISKLREEANQY